MQMKQILSSWCSVTEKEYPQYVHLILHPEDIGLSKIYNGGVMADTCNSAQKANRQIDGSVNGVIHSRFFHNHLRNFWVNNFLDSLIEFLISHINDSLDKVAPELRVSTIVHTRTRLRSEERPSIPY